MTAVILFEMMNADVLEDPHDGLEQVGHGLGVLGAALLVDDLPFRCDFVCDILV